MTQHTEPQSALISSDMAYRRVAHYLATSLPPPRDDTKEAWHLRDQSARATFDSLHPATEVESLLAAQFVVASMQAMDCLRVSHLPDTDTARYLKCTGHAVSLMRQAQTTLRTLERLQAGRGVQSAAPARVAKPPAPELPKPEVRSAPVSLPKLPFAPGPRVVDRVLDDVVSRMMSDMNPVVRQNPGKRDIETMVRRAR